MYIRGLIPRNWMRQFRLQKTLAGKESENFSGQKPFIFDILKKILKQVLTYKRSNFQVLS